MNLHVSVDRISAEVSQGKTAASDQDATSRLFALRKLAHRLQEEAEAADLEAMKAGTHKDKRLPLVQQGCIAIDFVIEALSNYLATDDRLFLSLAADGRQNISSTRKAL